MAIFLQSQLDDLFRYGHGWPAIAGICFFLLIWTLGWVKVYDMVADWWTMRQIRKELNAVRSKHLGAVVSMGSRR